MNILYLRRPIYIRVERDGRWKSERERERVNQTKHSQQSYKTIHRLELTIIMRKKFLLVTLGIVFFFFSLPWRNYVKEAHKMHEARSRPWMTSGGIIVYWTSALCGYLNWNCWQKAGGLSWDLKLGRETRVSIVIIRLLCRLQSENDFVTFHKRDFLVSFEIWLNLAHWQKRRVLHAHTPTLPISSTHTTSCLKLPETNQLISHHMLLQINNFLSLCFPRKVIF